MADNIDDRIEPLIDAIKVLCPKLCQKEYNLVGGPNFISIDKFIADRDVRIKGGLLYNPETKGYTMELVIVSKNNKEYMTPVKEVNQSVIAYFLEFIDKTEKVLKSLEPKKLRGLSKELDKL